MQILNIDTQKLVANRPVWNKRQTKRVQDMMCTKHGATNGTFYNSISNNFTSSAVVYNPTATVITAVAPWGHWPGCWVDTLWTVTARKQ